MGRIKGFFCSCLDDGADYSSSEPTFDRNLDVSHLATPHITATTESPVTPNSCRNTAEDKFSENYNSPHQLRSQQQQRANDDQNNKSSFNEQHHTLDPSTGHYMRPHNSQNQDSPSNSQPSSSSPFASTPVENLYEPPQNENQRQASPGLQRSTNAQAPPGNAVQPQPPPPPPPLVQPREVPTTSNGTGAKLSYDIISVREPLAKILAERQQLLQSQQQQRQILGDHEYIEVYGERGSSCFYEEIAGSVTSSVTYDQIGAASNHNYQVLVNAYSVAQRGPSGNSTDELNVNHNSLRGTSDSNNNQQEENAYDVTSHPADQVDGGPSTSGGQAKELGADVCPYERTSPTQADSGQLTQSIPVYSVINKATRRGSSIVRKTFDSTTPPEPPPKNLFISPNQPSMKSAISSYNDPSVSNSQHNGGTSRARSPIPQVPSTSSYSEVKRDLQDPLGNKHRNSRLPQPPPRYSKHPAFNRTAGRPLPSPNKLDGASFDNGNNDRRPSGQSPMIGDEEDMESLNNGYELLRSNLDDDQIDVGYEKIREPNRYSGGSIASQFYSRQFIDNGGYESVQPIYSSPSNCYEVLTPATASEIAAAAAAKLNVIENSLKKDQ